MWDITRILFVCKENELRLYSTIYSLPCQSSTCVHESTMTCESFFYKVCEENNCWIAIIFVFVAHRKYSRSFIKLQLDHWWHKDCFIDVLTTFLGLEYGSCIAVYAGSESSNLCSEDELKSYGFGTIWGWVFNDRSFIFGWTNPLNDTCCIFHGH